MRISTRDKNNLHNIFSIRENKSKSLPLTSVLKYIDGRIQYLEIRMLMVVEDDGLCIDLQEEMDTMKKERKNILNMLNSKYK